MNFSRNLKKLMLEKNVKNIDLAKALNVNKSNITRYLNGEMTPSYDLLEKIKNYFNCSYDDLLK